MINIDAMTESEKIKFFINAYEEAEEVKPVKKSTSAKTSKSTEKPDELEPDKDVYSVLYSKDSDVIIEKYDGSQFIFLPSKDKYYIKTKRSQCDLTKNQSDASKRLNIFFNKTVSNPIPVKNIVFDEIKCNITNQILKLLNYQSFLKENMISVNSLFQNHIDPDNNPVKENQELYKYLFQKTPISTDITRKYDIFFFNICAAILACWGDDGLDYFITKYMQSSIEQIYNISFVFNYGDYIKEISKKMNYKEFTDYICFSLYGQGTTGINLENLKTYWNYYDKYVDFYGNLFEKFSKHFKTDYKILMAVKNQIFSK